MVPPHAVTSRRQEQPLTFGARSPRREERQKNSPDLAKPQRAADVDCNCALCRFSINLTTTLQRLNSVYITFGSLPRRTSTRTKNEDCSALLFNPTIQPYCCQSNVSKTKSPMRCIKYAALVISNINCLLCLPSVS